MRIIHIQHEIKSSNSIHRQAGISQTIKSKQLTTYFRTSANNLTPNKDRMDKSKQAINPTRKNT
ncbi:hypothetical protein [Bacteroides togonis]|uniref:hypothetical protein n=1 Tax=Bacteroides togonis TaxID=1917883 RepID=UPI0013563EF5|nr:hypothetical protein [Bacteroides togonis]